MQTYRVKFDRIGRNHNVPQMVARVADADQLADYIHRHARPHLRSRDYDVFVDLDKGTGFIACGMHNGGQFTIRPEPAMPDTPIRRGEIIGERVDKPTASEAAHFTQCAVCGGYFDMRDLGQVCEHEGPLPHPARDKPQ